MEVAPNEWLNKEELARIIAKEWEAIGIINMARQRAQEITAEAMNKLKMVEESNGVITEAQRNV
jgi:hypothetical protein